MKRFIFITTILLFSTSVSHASIISLSSTNNFVNVGETLSINLILDTEGNIINSLEMNINFPKDLFSFKGYDSKTSMIPFWITPPTEQTDGSIYLSGVIPGGVERMFDSENPNNKSIKMLTLFFEAKQTGSAIFSIENEKALKNDGFGTRDDTKVFSKEIYIKESDKKDIPKDTQPPQPFTISIIPGSIFGKTPKLAVFEAQDNGGGIAKYQSRISYDEFKDVTSPLPLPYRLFNYTLYVRAYDFDGNFHEQVITVDGDRPYGVLIIVTIVLIFMLLYKYKIRK